MSNNIHNAGEGQRLENSPAASLPPPVSRQEMLKRLEALALRIKNKEIEIGDSEYELELNDLKAKCCVIKKSLIKTLNRFLPEPAPEHEHSTDELNVLIRQDEPFTEEEIKAAEELLTKPDIFAEFHEDFKLTGYRAARELTDAGLLILGRTLRHWCSCEYGHGKLATGKTEFYNHVASFFLLAKTISLTTFSEKFLFYAGGEDGNALKGFLMVYGESDLASSKGEDTFKQKYLRQALTENTITHGTVEQESKGKKHKVKYSRLNGPFTMVITCVDSPSHFDPQTASRLYCRHFKHTHETIKQVLESKANRAANPQIEDNSKLLAAQRKWRCALSSLKKYDPADSGAIQVIKIPFSGQLVFKKKRHTEADMRAFDRLIESIQVSALLNQKQRTIKDTTLIATWQDFIHVKAAYFSSIPTAKGLGHDLIDKFLELFEWWQKLENNGKKSKREICDALNVDLNTGKKWIYDWLKAELLNNVTDSDKKTAKCYYEPATNAKAISNQMLDDECLGIESIQNIISTKNNVPSENNSGNLGTGDTSTWVSTENNKLEQAIPSDQARNQQLGTCPGLISLDISQLRPSESAINSAIQDMDDACPANSENQYITLEVQADMRKYYPGLLPESYVKKVMAWLNKQEQDTQKAVIAEYENWASSESDPDWSWRVVGQIEAAIPDMSAVVK